MENDDDSVACDDRLKLCVCAVGDRVAVGSREVDSDNCSDRDGVSVWDNVGVPETDCEPPRVGDVVCSDEKLCDRDRELVRVTSDVPDNEDDPDSDAVKAADSDGERFKEAVARKYAAERSDSDREGETVTEIAILVLSAVDGEAPGAVTERDTEGVTDSTSDVDTEADATIELDKDNSLVNVPLPVVEFFVFVRKLVNDITVGVDVTDRVHPSELVNDDVWEKDLFRRAEVSVRVEVSERLALFSAADALR
jgi:hypothetical protein